MTGWSEQAYAAARARLAERRPLDAVWVASFENDAAVTCRQTGEDPVLALDAVAAGLHAAVSASRGPGRTRVGSADSDAAMAPTGPSGFHDHVTRRTA